MRHGNDAVGEQWAELRVIKISHWTSLERLGHNKTQEELQFLSVLLSSLTFSDLAPCVRSHG